MPCLGNSLWLGIFLGMLTTGVVIMSTILIYTWLADRHARLALEHAIRHMKREDIIKRYNDILERPWHHSKTIILLARENKAILTRADKASAAMWQMDTGARKVAGKDI